MSANLSALRVLLIDDNANMRSIIAAILEGIGIKDVRHARDGEIGLSILREWPADIAIIDYLMTPIDGLEFTRKVRFGRGALNNQLPIIMVTGYADRIRVLEARDAGVTELVVKPVTANAVLSRLNQVIYKPRPFVRTDDYFGPDRRRRNDPDYKGPMRRQKDNKPDPDPVLV
jgi:two-component system, chemotaxis family, chemotaxis protein CheY